MNNFASGCRRSLGIAGRWALSLNKNVYTICFQVPGILRKVWGRECKSLKMGRRTMKCHRLGKTNSNHELGTAADACPGADLDRSRVGWGWRRSSQGPYLSLKSYLLSIDLEEREALPSIVHPLMTSPDTNGEFWSSLGNDPGRMKWW